MLDDRKTAILSAVVQEYITTAQPVGSNHIAEAPTIKVSSATVRSEMAQLEHEGYLVQPHTSAGRIPTDKGYRYFVDHLTAPGVLDQATTKQVGEFFSAAHGRLEELLHQTSNLLSTLTNNASLVVGPARRSGGGAADPTRVALGDAWRPSWSCSPTERSSTRRSISTRVTTTSVSPPPACTSRPRSMVSVLSGVDSVAPTGDPSIDRICDAALHAVRSEAAADQVFTGGVSTVANAFDAVDVVRSVLQTLEQQFVVVTLVSDIVNRGMSVAIGVEHGVEPLSACSVVVAPVVIDGEHLGSIGVLGPTRMNYPLALATVDVVSEQLAHRIEDG